MHTALQVRAAEPPSISPATLLHTLHLYGAAAVTAFGWAACRLLDWDATPWVPLWFCGALLVYNVDRLRSDPADALNIPRRDSAARRLRGVSAFTAALAGTTLVVLPVLRRDWITLALVLGGAVVCLSYSVPMLGRRIKEVPVLKTFVAPTIVAAAVFALPWIHEGAPVDHALFAVVAGRAWGLLLFNMILCDLRDVEGDRRTGVMSLPGFLGERGTCLLLIGLLIAIESLAFLMAACAPATHAIAWRILCVIGPLYLGSLIAAVRLPRSERFYEWWVEGMFFLPALAVLADEVIGAWVGGS